MSASHMILTRDGCSQQKHTQSTYDMLDLPAEFARFCLFVLKDFHTELYDGCSDLLMFVLFVQ